MAGGNWVHDGPELASHHLVGYETCGSPFCRNEAMNKLVENRLDIICKMYHMVLTISYSPR